MGSNSSTKSGTNSTPEQTASNSRSLNAAPVVLVTGASGAIGLEIATQAAAAGAAVAVHGASQASATAAVEKIQQRVSDARAVALGEDFYQAGAAERLIAKTVGVFTGLDAVIHCASIGAPGVTGLFNATEPNNHGNHIALVAGTFENLCYYALPHLAARTGAIVTVVADSGRFAAPRQSLIGSANAAIVNFVRNLALEIAREQVKINCISLSFVADTPIFEKYLSLGRADSACKRAGLGLPTPADIAPLALFLCGPAATKITGQVISINGGLNA